MMLFNAKAHPVLNTVFAACLVGAVVGCSAQEQSPDPRITHPIEVGREQVSVTIDIPAEGEALSPGDARRLNAFIRDFAVRGRTVITVESTLGMRARDVLLASGLRANEIAILPDTTVKAPGALLTFTANVANVPTCGDWGDSYTFQPSNDPSTDFGCSSRRNMGLTVADPGDMIESQPMSGRGAARRDAVIDGYNAGDPISPAAGAATNTQAATGAGN